MIKKLTATLSLITFFISSGCQIVEENDTMTDDSTDNSISQNENQESNMPIVETEYGRGAESDGADTNSNEEPTEILTTDSNTVIIYFSRSGNTQNLARMIRNHNGGDILELAVADPYPADYEQAVSRATEERESQEYPVISTNIPDLSQYDSVYLGYQTWGMTLSNPIMSFLLDYGSNLAGKTIYPFSTNAGYGEGDTLSRIAELAPDATVATSFSIQDEELLDNQTKVIDWLDDTN